MYLGDLYAIRKDNEIIFSILIGGLFAAVIESKFSKSLSVIFLLIIVDLGCFVSPKRAFRLSALIALENHWNILARLHFRLSALFGSRISLFFLFREYSRVPDKAAAKYLSKAISKGLLEAKFVQAFSSYYGAENSTADTRKMEEIASVVYVPALIEVAKQKLESGDSRAFVKTADKIFRALSNSDEETYFFLEWDTPNTWREYHFCSSLREISILTADFISNLDSPAQDFRYRYFFEFINRSFWKDTLWVYDNWCFYYGRFFELGLGCNINKTMAYSLYARASLNGNEKALVARDRIDENLTQKERNEAINDLRALTEERFSIMNKFQKRKIKKRMGIL